MEQVFREVMIVRAETNIELWVTLSNFIYRMEEHIEKFPNYSYAIETLGGKKLAYKAKITITRYEKQKTELAEGDPGSYGVL